MTEETARKKWCPFSRAMIEQDSGHMTAINRRYYDDWNKDPTEGCRCLASDCMVWQFVVGNEALGFCGLVQLVNLTPRD
jgi:asparagine synthetase A